MTSQLYFLKKCSPDRHDCTAPYIVVFDYKNPHPTVKEFLDSIIFRKSDWGRIKISPSPEYNNVWDLIRYHGKIDSIRYHWGKMDKNYDYFIEKYGSRKIASATADGGWSLMDYVLLLEDNVKYEEFGDIDIPTDFEKTVKKVRTYIEQMREDQWLEESEYNAVMVIIDGVEARQHDFLKALNND